MELGALDSSYPVAGAIAPLIGAIGTAQFESSLLTLTRDTARCFHLTAFCCSLSRTTFAAPKVVLAADSAGSTSARRLASRYVRHYWQFDPANRVASREPELSRGATLRLRPNEIERSDYRHDCYDSVNLIDRFSVIKTFGIEAVRLNFYRRRPLGPFNETDMARLSAVAELALPAIRKHHALTVSPTQDEQRAIYWKCLAARAPNLGHREIQVCIEIILGLSSAAIASKFGRSINTISTQRLQAYAKLQISSQRELFQIVMQPRIA